MNPKKLYQCYLKRKDKFHSFINNIKANASYDLYTVINTTLSKNPYSTKFHIDFLLEKTHVNENLFFLFIKTIFKYYKKYYSFLFVYFVQYILYKIINTRKTNFINKQYIGIDIFFLIQNILKENKFEENYFSGLYKILNEQKQPYLFIARLYGINEKLSSTKEFIHFLRFLNKNNKSNSIIIEHQLLSFIDFFKLFHIISIYPFKTLRLVKKNDVQYNRLFNKHLIKDIINVQFKTFSRYIFGKNVSKLNIFNKIFSWSEFQSIERSFNFAIREKDNKIKLIGCQFYINYETYFNTFIDDIDFKMKSSPHKVLVNGNHYLLKRDLVTYEVGVSLRYKKLFEINKPKTDKNILILGSYLIDETKYILKSVKNLNNIIFKPHPTVDISNYGELEKNIYVSNENIYDLFPYTKLVVGTASGTLCEAVAYGISVIVMASQDNLTANPLVDFGKGKIWDIAFSKRETKELYNKLIKYRMDNKQEIESISLWYKKNFFIEPTDEKIKHLFRI